MRRVPKKVSYIFEKECSMPLCAVVDNIYFNFENGQVIDDERIVEFINIKLKNKDFIKSNCELIIEQFINSTNKVIGYNYNINGCSTYTDCKMQPVNNRERNFINDKLAVGKYKKELVWGDEI